MTDKLVYRVDAGRLQVAVRMEQLDPADGLPFQEVTMWMYVDELIDVLKEDLDKHNKKET